MTLALTGFGNVGQGVATLLARNGHEYTDRYGVKLRLCGVADRGGAVVDPEGLDPSAVLAVKRSTGTVAEMTGGEAALAGDEFLERTGADILLEAASTSFLDAEPGWGYVRSALERDMDVVLASKGCLALYWSELMDLANDRGRMVRYSATIGAPLPTLEIAQRGLIGTTISGFEGIVNATTHQILTAMSQGKTYEEGVREAQDIGIAETDPTLDVDGWDAAAKAVILANAVLGARLTLADVAREGIRDLTLGDIQTAAADGCAIKLVASAHRRGKVVTASVRPQRRPLQDALGRLTGDDMGIVFNTEPFGRVSTAVESSGAGGGITTALTMLRDVINLARDRR